MKTYYLAHPYRSKAVVRAWELRFEQALDIQLINPFSDLKILDRPMTRSDDEAFKVVKSDLAVIRDSKTKGLVAVIDGHKSFGTPCEMFHASMLGKCVLTLCLDPELLYHPWVRANSSVIVTSLDVLYATLSRLRDSDYALTKLSKKKYISLEDVI